MEVYRNGYKVMKRSILYIDDEEVNLRQFKVNFRKDYEVEIAASGKEALDILDDNTFDLIITDQRMPEMTGIEFLEELQERIPNPPPSRIMLSAYAPSKEVGKAKELYNLHMFVSKPCDIDVLKEIIAKVIAA